MFSIRRAGIFVFGAIAVLISLLKPFPGLTPQGHHVLSIVLISLALWIVKTGETPYLGGCALLIAGSLMSGLPLSTVTCGYISGAIWVLIPALFFGYALVKTGLGKRIAYFVLKSFTPNYGTICLSWFIIGLLLSVLTPSIVVRLAIVMPIAVHIIEACEIEHRSKGSALISLTAWATAILPGTAWQTGSLWGIILPMGFYPEALKPLATSATWFLYMAVPWLLITLIFLVLVFIIFRPGKPLGIRRELLQERYRELGRIKADEIVCGVILLCVIMLFSTERWTGIKTAEVALAGLAALIFFGIVKVHDVSSGINWDIVNFIAVAIGLTSLFNASGFSAYLKPFVEPYAISLAHNPLIFILAVTVTLWVVRFVDVPWGYTTIALVSMFMTPLYETFNLHPVFISVAMIAAGNSFFLAYQQPFAVIGDSMMQSKGWSGRHVAIGGLLYAVAVLTGIVISYFYWKTMGLV